MSYKSILVHIDGTADGERRVRAGGRLAAQFGAHVTGFAIVPPLELPQRLRSHPGAKAILKEEFDKSLAAAEEMVRAFPAAARAAGAPSADAKVVQSDPVEAVVTAARTVDLVVLSQPDRDDVGAFGSHFVQRACTEVGRPVLLVPRKGECATIGRRILVAWKNADASARALADARPFLERADYVAVLAVDEDGRGASAAEAVGYIERHGTRASGIVVKAEDAGAAILAQAQKLGVDLVVMGAFARQRLSEMILGGATDAVLPNATTCVLMSH